MTQAWDAWSNIVGVTTENTGDAISAGRGGSQNAFEGKASYSFSGSDVNGKVWVSGLHQKVENLYAPTNAKAAAASYGNRLTGADDNAWATDIGANVNFANLGLTGYYYKGEGIGQTVQLNGGFDRAGKKRDSQGGYVQATYVLPTKTKLGLSWGESKLEKNTSGDTMIGDLKDEMWAFGVYHPLTKHLNLVAEYSNVESEYGTREAKGRTASLGGILFF
jgi:hypothetical protein